MGEAVSEAVNLARGQQAKPHTARPVYPFAGVGEAVGAFQLAKLLGTRRPDLLMTRSSVLSWEEIANSNTIFLGPPKLVPHLKDIPIEQELVVDSAGGLIRNLHPATGEPASFPDQPRPGETETHALISRLPGLHGRGEVFIFSCNWTGGTLGAVHYVTERDYAKDVVRRLRLPSGELPKHYQIVVKVSIQNRYPVKVTYMLHRVLGR